MYITAVLAGCQAILGAWSEQLQWAELVRAVRDAFPAAKATQRPLLFCAPEPTLPAEWEKDVAPLDYPLRI